MTGVISTVPRYTIDLDLPPGDRWDLIIEDYKDQWIEVQNVIKNQLKDELGSFWGGAADKILSGIMATANKTKQVYYADELKGLARKSGMKLGRAVLLQLVYEVSACCTSIVKRDQDGNLHHIRTMDWQMEFLEPLTVELDFIKNGELVFSCTSWAGYVGVLTGMRPDAYSVSVNFRLTENGSLWTNIKNAMTASWPIGFLLREILESENEYSNATRFLASSELIAPCYFTCCGIEPEEGCIITRNVSDEENRFTLDDGDIVQPNMDHWSIDPQMDIMDSVERRDLARALLADLEDVNKESLWDIMSQDPIFNSITVYGTYMSPSTGYLETRLPSKLGFNPGNIPPRRRKGYVIYQTLDQIENPDNRRRDNFYRRYDQLEQFVMN